MDKTIFAIVGRTGSGKDTIMRELTELFPMVHVVVSSTTRPKRSTEENGREHIFLSKNEFDEKKEKEGCIAYTKIGDYEYMTSYQDLEKYNFYIIDPNGIEFIKKLKIEGVNLLTFYIDAGNKHVRYNRCKERSDFNEAFEKRCQSEDDQFTRFEKRFPKNYIRVKNYDKKLYKAVNKIRYILEGYMFVYEKISNAFHH